MWRQFAVTPRGGKQGKQLAEDRSDYSTQEIIYFANTFIATSLSQPVIYHHQKIAIEDKFSK